MACVGEGDDRAVGIEEARVLGRAAGGLGAGEQLSGILAAQRGCAVEAQLREPARDSPVRRWGSLAAA
jgi:hypothetical protein